MLTGDDKVDPCIHMANSSVNSCLCDRVLHVCIIKADTWKIHRVSCCHDPHSSVIEVVSLICV